MEFQKHVLFVFFILFMIFHLLSCASTGKIFDLKKVDQIEISKSTKDDILNLFGLPMSIINIVENNKKFEIWSYEYIDPFGFKKTLALKFDEQGVVDGFGRTAHEIDDKRKSLQ